jgi:ABC-2 type transport system permease protein
MAMMEGTRARGWLRHFRSAAWLGWQIESNWADPYVFAVYALARPMALSLILVAIYAVVSGGQLHGERFTWIYVGNAFFVFVPLMLVGVGWTVVEDREQFQVLKYVYCSPIGLFTYLAGRAVTKSVSATFSCVSILVVGALFLGVRYHTTPLLALAGLSGFVLGVVGLFGMGLLLAGAGLVFARQSMNLNEGTAAVLFLVCGAVFPMDVLPGIARYVGWALPLTWWLEAMRRSWAGVKTAGAIGAFSTPAVFLALAVTAVSWYAFGAWSYRRLERRAKQRGLLDQTTAF